MINARRIEDLSLPGLGADRAPVFAGGIAILAEVMSTLRIERMEVSSGALREGLLYDMLGRLHDEDARERSIRAMQRRYHVDLEQALRVETTAAALFDQVAGGLAALERRYRTAARLGGASARSRARYCARPLPPSRRLSGRELGSAGLRALGATAAREPRDASSAQARRPVPRRAAELLGGRRRSSSSCCLRLADAVEPQPQPFAACPRSRSRRARIRLEVNSRRSWLDDNPLTEADLEQERQWLRARGFELERSARERG